MSSSQSTKLFTSTKVGALDLQHRVVMAPLTRNRAEAGTAIPADFAADYYAQRASRKSYRCSNALPELS